MNSQIRSASSSLEAPRQIVISPGHGFELGAVDGLSEHPAEPNRDETVGFAMDHLRRRGDCRKLVVPGARGPRAHLSHRAHHVDASIEAPPPQITHGFVELWHSNV
jgi:hypothetical protein